MKRTRPETPGPRHHELAGRKKCYDTGCGMPECVAVQAAYSASYRRTKKHGRRRTVDAAPVRNHIEALRSQYQISRQSIADRTGVKYTTIEKICNGSTKRVKVTTARAILSCKPDGMEWRSMVDATVTKRQLMAMARLGWSFGWIAEQLGGICPSNLSQLLHKQTKVSGWRAAQIADLARQVGDRRGPNRYTALKAAHLGWLPPAAYEEDWSLPDPEDYEHLPRFSATAERREARHDVVRSWTLANRTAREIANYLITNGLVETSNVEYVMRTVQRDRTELGIRVIDLEAA